MLNDIYIYIPVIPNAKLNKHTNMRTLKPIRFIVFNEVTILFVNKFCPTQVAGLAHPLPSPPNTHTHTESKSTSTDLFLLAILDALCVDLDVGTITRGRQDLGVQQELEALLGKATLEIFGHLHVDAQSAHMAQELHTRHLRA